MANKKPKTVQNEIQEVAEKVIKKKRPGKSEQMKVQTTPEENSRYIRHVMASYNLPPINIDDPKQVQDRIEWYFNHCIEDGMKPTVAGICNALGVDRTTFYLWGVGERRGKNPEYVNLVKKAQTTLRELWEQFAADGKVNPVTFIFLMKNHFGYTDKQEVVVTPNSPLGDQSDTKQLEEKYKESIIVEAESEDVD